LTDGLGADGTVPRWLMRSTRQKRVAGADATNALKARWKIAARWRRAVEKALAGTGLTFTQWQVLDALDELIAETDEAATQSEVAARLELDHGTISIVMRTLADRALVDRCPDLSGRALRVLLTKRSTCLLRECAEAVELASVRLNAARPFHEE
jgi:DNA-binding MarR family transcriptional regulator